MAIIKQINAANSEGAIVAHDLGAKYHFDGTELDTKYAPQAHASTAKTYGSGTNSNYGHVKLSDSTASTSAASAGVAASPKAVSDALTAAKSYADTKVAGLVESAPDTLNTLNELAAALGDDPNFATTVATQIGTKANASDLTAHTGNTENPHGVTKAQIGLGNVENKSSSTIRGEITKANVTSALGTSSTGTGYLKQDGTWATPANTTYRLEGVLGDNNTFVSTLTPSAGSATTSTVPAMTAATADTAGTAGLVPAPAAGQQTRFLRGDGTWAAPTNTKNTTGTTEKTATKLYLAGATAQSSSPTTYSNKLVYIGTDNCLYSTGAKTLTATDLAAGTGLT